MINVINLTSSLRISISCLLLHMASTIYPGCYISCLHFSPKKKQKADTDNPTRFLLWHMLCIAELFVSVMKFSENKNKNIENLWNNFFQFCSYFFPLNCTIVFTQ